MGSGKARLWGCLMHGSQPNPSVGHTLQENHIKEQINNYLLNHNCVQGIRLQYISMMVIQFVSMKQSCMYYVPKEWGNIASPTQYIHTYEELSLGGKGLCSSGSFLSLRAQSSARRKVESESIFLTKKVASPKQKALQLRLGHEGWIAGVKEIRKVGQVEGECEE